MQLNNVLFASANVFWTPCMRIDWYTVVTVYRRHTNEKRKRKMELVEERYIADLQTHKFKAYEWLCINIWRHWIFLCVGPWYPTNTWYLRHSCPLQHGEKASHNSPNPICLGVLGTTSIAFSFSCKLLLKSDNHW